MTAIRYWTQDDQRHARTISFSSVAKALEMLAFYQGAGFRCELAQWDFFLLLWSLGAVGLSVTLPLKTWQRPWTSVTHNYVKLILLCASPQSEHTCPIRGIFMVIISTWTKQTNSNLTTADVFLLTLQQWKIQQYSQHSKQCSNEIGKNSKLHVAAHGI